MRLRAAAGASVTFHQRRAQASNIAPVLMSYIICRKRLEAVDYTVTVHALRPECLLYMAKPQWTAIRVVLTFLLDEQLWESLTESNAVNTSPCKSKPNSGHCRWLHAADPDARKGADSNFARSSIASG